VAFSFEASESPNQLDSGTVSLALSPDASVFILANMSPGSSITGQINVANTGTLDEYYQITANWAPAGSTGNSAATRLANELSASVTVGTTPLYVGSFAGLIDEPASPGRLLTLVTGNEDVSFTFALPSDAGTVYQGIDLGFALDFVASS